MDTEAAPAPRKTNRTALIIVFSVLGFVVLCTVLNIIGNNYNTPESNSVVTPTIDLTPVVQQLATKFFEFFGPDIETTSGQVQPLGCANFVGRKLVLPGGESAFVPCPADSASVALIGADKLPGALGEGMTFVSGVDVAVSPALNTEKYKLTVHFVMPPGATIDRMTILHWDGTKWEDLGPLQTSDAQSTTVGLFVFASK